MSTGSGPFWSMENFGDCTVVVLVPRRPDGLTLRSLSHLVFVLSIGQESQVGWHFPVKVPGPISCVAFAPGGSTRWICTFYRFWHLFFVMISGHVHVFWIILIYFMIYFVGFLMVLDGFLVSMFPWPWISSTRRVLRCHTGERAQGAADAMETPGGKPGATEHASPLRRYLDSRFETVRSIKPAATRRVVVECNGDKGGTLRLCMTLYIMRLRWICFCLLIDCIITTIYFMLI